MIGRYGWSGDSFAKPLNGSRSAAAKVIGRDEVIALEKRGIVVINRGLLLALIRNFKADIATLVVADEARASRDDVAAVLGRLT